MFDLIKNFPKQILEALAIGSNAGLSETAKTPVQNIVVCGLGGSGIGGNILAELLRGELTVPVIVNKGYTLAHFVSDPSLVILCSYSGNTEETLHCAKEALARGLSPVCITSGGKLLDLANEKGLDHIVIPGGFPPRACLGYSTIQLFFVLKHYGLISGGFEHSFRQAAAFLSQNQKQIMGETELLAKKMAGNIIIAYAEDRYESTVLRLKQQVNENGKMQCWYNILPELNHNELVGWRKPNDNIVSIIFRASDEYPRNSRRIEFTKTVIDKLSANRYEITALGSSPYEKRFYLIHWADWLTYFMAKQQGFDPMEIEVLDNLKSHMAAMKD